MIPLTTDNLEEWVQDTLLDYAAKGYTQEDVKSLGGHFAHHPTPNCLGGVEGIWLFEEDHAVHGVLQSEVFQHPCIFNWEKQHLDGELLTLFHKWKSKQSRLAAAKTHFEKTDEGKSKVAVLAASKLHEEKTQEGDSLFMKNLHKRLLGEGGKSTMALAGGRALAKKTSKAVEVTSPEGEVLWFPSIAEAARSLQLERTLLKKVVSGGRLHHKGYIAKEVPGPNPFY